MRIINNIVTDVANRHVEVPDCAGTEVANNLLWNPGGAFQARVGTNTTDIGTLNGFALASGNLNDDPGYVGATLEVSSTSVAVNAGLSIDAIQSAFVGAHGVSMATDRGGAARPAGIAPDMGAYEQP